MRRLLLAGLVLALSNVLDAAASAQTVKIETGTLSGATAGDVAASMSSL